MEKEILPHQQRVIEEKQNLQEKYVKLRDFLSTEIFNSLIKEEQDDLFKQYNVMKDYIDILDRRINRF